MTLAPGSLILTRSIRSLYQISAHLSQMWSSYAFKGFYNQFAGYPPKQLFKNLTCVASKLWAMKAWFLGNKYLQHMHLWILHDTSEVWLWMDKPTWTARGGRSGLWLWLEHEWHRDTHWNMARRVCMYSSVRLRRDCLYTKRSVTGRHRIGRIAAIPWRSFRLLETSQSEVSVGKRKAQLFTEFAT